MADQDVALPSARTQTTSIEQARAVAEVVAAVRAAREVPRDEQAAIKRMEHACGSRALADKAFFRYPRGGQQITGPSIHLARAIAVCWGNVQYGITELDRDDVAGMSQMMAFAWDVESNTRTSSAFIHPHAIDTQRGRKELTELRDIYESNANAGARRVRECIFAVLPPWFVDQAKDAASKTLVDGGGVPLPQRIAATIKAYADIGVSERQLMHKVGRRTPDWTPFEVAALTVVGQSLRRGETTIEQEFTIDPAASVTAEQLQGQGHPAPDRPAADETPTPDPPPASPSPPAEPTDGAGPQPEPEPDSERVEPTQGESPPEPPPEPQAEPEPRPGTRSSRKPSQPQLAKIKLLAKDLGMSETQVGGEHREDYLALLTDIALRPITSATQLSGREAGWVIEKMESIIAKAPSTVPRTELEQEAQAARDRAEENRDEDRAAVYSRLIGGAISRGFTEPDVRLSLEQHFAQPIEDLNVEQLTGYMTSLAIGKAQLVRVEDQG